MPRTTADYRWTKPKMLEFLRHLSHSGSVTAASRQVGMSRQSAYNRARMDGGFADMWDRAVVLARAMRGGQGDTSGAGDNVSLDSVNQSTSSTCIPTAPATARPIPAPFNRYSASLQ